jgi:hypothetical protein
MEQFVVVVLELLVLQTLAVVLVVTVVVRLHKVVDRVL